MQGEAGLKQAVWLDGRHLTLQDVGRVVRDRAPVAYRPEALDSIRRSREMLERRIAQGERIYGVNTGFGALDARTVSAQENVELNHNLLLSHASGVGPAAPPEVVRAMMLLRANVFATGRVGVSEATAQAVVALLNAGVVPVVPELGSVCACGDLAPLAHLFLPLIGFGEALVDGQRVPGAEAMRRVGLEPLRLSGRDGLALINGTEQASATGAVALLRGWNLVRAAEVAAAMSAEALLSLSSLYDPRVHGSKPHPGQAATARNLGRLLTGSRWVDGRQGKLRDALSVRCIPQVLGAVRDALGYATAVLEREFNGANDNPLLFVEDGVINSNAGNFHGQSVGLAMDQVKAAICTLSVMSERRTARLVDEKLNEGLPAFLIHPSGAQQGLHSGLMIPQYTAASLVAESRILAAPASVHSVPTSANSEDHVSMANISARQALTLVEYAEYVVAIELLAAAQALELRGLDRCAAATRAAVRAARDVSPFVERDRPFADDIRRLAEWVRSGGLTGSVQETAGDLE